MIEAAQSHSCSSAKTVVRVMWCCCHWGLRPDQLLKKLPDESQLAAELALFDCRELTAAAWTCGVLQDTRQQHLLEAVAKQASSHLPITGVLPTSYMPTCRGWIDCCMQQQLPRPDSTWKATESRQRACNFVNRVLP